MRIEPKDRTRILLAFVLTLIALPALISANRSSSDRPATVAAVSSGRGLTAGQQLGSEPSHAVESSPSTTVLAPPPPASSAPTDALSIPVPTTTVAARPAHQEEGKGTFSNFTSAPPGIDVARSCAHGRAPIGATITISDLNTGRSATCVVQTRLDASSGYLLNMDEAVFASISDLVDGVAPIRITW